MSSPKSRSVAAIIFDSNGPGAIALTVMCLRPRWRARWRVSWWIAALLDEYEYVSSIGTWMASIEPMLITRAGSSAVPAASSCGSSAGEEERRLHVEVEHLVPRVGGKVGERRAPRGARVVDEMWSLLSRDAISAARSMHAASVARSAGRLTQVPSFESSAAISSHTSFLRDEM